MAASSCHEEWESGGLRDRKMLRDNGPSPSHERDIECVEDNHPNPKCETISSPGRPEAVILLIRGRSPTPGRARPHPGRSGTSASSETWYSAPSEGGLLFPALWGCERPERTAWGSSAHSGQRMR